MFSYLDNTDSHPCHVEASITAEGQYYDRHLIAKHNTGTHGCMNGRNITSYLSIHSYYNSTLSQAAEVEGQEGLLNKF